MTRTYTIGIDDGDFRSPDSIGLQRMSDIIITNPPFSLFREFILQLAEQDSHYIVLGNLNALSVKDLFPLVMSGRMWLGTGIIDNIWFEVPDDTEPRECRYRVGNGRKWISMGNVCWYTNLDHEVRHRMLRLSHTYDPTSYPHYDNVDAIEVSRVDTIPSDYHGLMGVPITFVGRYNPDQFEIVGNEYSLGIGKGRGYVGGKRKYSRVFIRRRGKTS